MSLRTADFKSAALPIRLTLLSCSVNSLQFFRGIFKIDFQIVPQYSQDYLMLLLRANTWGIKLGSVRNIYRRGCMHGAENMVKVLKFTPKRNSCYLAEIFSVKRDHILFFPIKHGSNMY